jgi:enamidase
VATLAIKNIGKLLSGRLEDPVLGADTLLLADGKIAAIGSAEVLAGVAPDKTVDAAGTTVLPGLLDSHCHPVLGDFTPRQKQLDYIDSCLHGGVTTVISAGEAHTPGRPKDRVGTKALAILAHLSAKNARPAGVKLHGGAVILEPGLTEADFAEMADAGVWLVGEIGLGAVRTPEQAVPMVQWAHAHGMKVLMHTGGTSIPGSSTVGAADVLAIRPDVVCHLNGGPTAAPDADIRDIIVGSGLAVEIVQCGNFKAAMTVAGLLKERDELHRLILGNDAPSGTGVIPLGIVRNIAYLASVCGIAPEVAVCCATGNTARVFGLPVGVIEVGAPADLVVADAPMGSAGADLLAALVAGDVPGIGLVLIDGQIKVTASRNTPPPWRKPIVG